MDTRPETQYIIQMGHKIRSNTRQLSQEDEQDDIVARYGGRNRRFVKQLMEDKQV